MRHMELTVIGTTEIICRCTGATDINSGGAYEVTYVKRGKPVEDNDR